ncbi:hypothetical protein [Priestia megaterium]|jgi:hypothetical protein|uniref:hypothetical protein n=1 Tax=Priestia megaterium TaxID=1404 RepID=UPI001A93EB00|nr:hypothetical protein [Priestia megaterium]QSX23611.1 hypothetical protein J0P05_27905 [Priestia megaterium]
MTKAINLWSFVFSLLCVCLTFITFAHPLLLSLNFYVAIVIFLVGIIGFFGINNWKSAVRSILTIILSAVLIIVTGWIIFVGNLFS